MSNMAGPLSSSGSEEEKTTTTTTTPGSPPAKDDATKDAPAQPGFFKRTWAKVPIDKPTFILMLKGPIAPVIAIAAYQSDAWATEYSTLGYLAAIMALISMAIQPRAKFIQAIITSSVFVSLGACVALIQIACTVTARQATSRGGATVDGSSGSTQSVQYNGSASATAAVWLFFTIWLSNCVRAYRPALMLPIIQYSIFTIVASTYAPQFPNMAAGLSFVRRLIVTFFTGFGLATGVSLLIFPMTSRNISGKQMAGGIGLIKAMLNAHDAYFSTIISPEEPQDGKVKGTAEAGKLKELIAAVGQLFGKIRIEIDFAKKEAGYGKLRPEDISATFKKFRMVLIPTLGLSTFCNIMQSAREHEAVDDTAAEYYETTDAIRRLETKEWNEVLSMSREKYVHLKLALMGGLDHISYVLEFVPRPKQKKNDEEAKGDASPAPGDPGFSDYLEAEMEKFHKHRETVVQRWCEQKGIDLPTKFIGDTGPSESLERIATQAVRRKGNQQQLYLVLFIEFTIHAIGKAILEFARFADSKVSDGTMTKNRFINPGWSRMKKFLLSIIHPGDSNTIFADDTNAAGQIWIGDSLKPRKDPEHLPPKNAYERITNHIRAFPHFLGSPQSAFGFRAAVATLSIGICAYLSETWVFFLRQRGLWAMIMTAISMGAHAGQGIFGFGARILGTVVAMAGSIVIWYIGYKQPGAIIPIFFIWLMGGFWFMLKNPTLAIIGVLSMVTSVLIIGYELQAGKIGYEAVASNGQPFYPIYILSPYRLAAVAVGVGVAFVWTYFPYPVTTHFTLRKDLGATIYLMANYHSCVHSTVETRLHLGLSAKPDPAELESLAGVVGKKKPKSPAAKLDKARLKCLQKCVAMLSRLREHSGFTKFEPTFGGEFPRKSYDDIIASLAKIFNYLSLIAYSADAFANSQESEETQWMKDFRRFTSEVNLTSHELTSTLCLLSAAITNGQPLPPYLSVPKPFAVAERMSMIDPEILSIRHVSEPCYAAFAVLEVTSTLLLEEVAHMIRVVTDLIGEVDFSFHPHNRAVASESSSVLTESTYTENEREVQADRAERWLSKQMSKQTTKGKSA